MNLRIVSIWLLFLFSIVIAFPGYGSSVRAVKKNTIVCADEKETSWNNLLLVLKKCLAKGINMIEEERTTEEDEVGPSAVFEYVGGMELYQARLSQAKLFAYQHSYYPLTTRTIFTPPDCFFN